MLSVSLKRSPTVVILSLKCVLSVSAPFCNSLRNGLSYYKQYWIKHVTHSSTAKHGITEHLKHRPVIVRNQKQTHSINVQYNLKQPDTHTEHFTDLGKLNLLMVV